MNILIVSECSGKALPETRRILDQFAERRGERTWQTPITQAGLDTLRQLLRKTARRNTAVACHWIRGRDHTELLWIVGNARRFNAEGAVPTNTTTRNVLRSESENDWHSGEDIQLLAQISALLHDLGKASVAFQQRLRKPNMEKNLYRHEWVSLRLFLAFVGDDDDETWLKRMASPTTEDDAHWTAKNRYWCDGLDDAAPPPFAKLPPLAAAIAWLVVTHHRLPVLPVFGDDGQQKWLGCYSREFSVKRLPNILQSVTHEWNEIRCSAPPKDIATYWDLADALPVSFPKWQGQAARLAQRLQTLRSRPGKTEWLDNPYTMHLARLSLMLADHHYSSLPPHSSDRVKGDGKGSLFANTHSDGTLKQALDEHLLGVARDAGRIVRSFPGFERHLPRLARHRGLRKRSESARFRWQDWAADAAEGMRAQAIEHGAFIINMASTGCGKTLANARIMNALAEPQFGLRCTFALGLRTLTMQTGRAYRQDLHLGEDELAVRVGGSASKALFEYYLEKAEATGSASTQALIEEDSHVFYEGAYADHGLLSKAMSDPAIRSLLSAPMLVCTIDHLMPATESQRAGRQIAPMLRLMSSDLVLDELDDFDLADLPALTRLMHWAGLLGTRVLISSATLPPALVEGMFLAYRAGRAQYRRNRGMRIDEASVLDIACLWTDEFGAAPHACSDLELFRRHHTVFVQKRVGELQKAEPRRCGELLPLRIAATNEAAIRREFAAQLQAAIVRAHGQHWERCPLSQKRVSFGLVRMANIEPLFDVALELFRLGAPEDHRVHLCVYHSRFPLLLRSAIENQLDTTFDRRKPEAVFSLPDIREAIDKHPETNHLFVVLASPVCEVGRDWDASYAIAEPSSMRSLIQLAGRVQRHRNRPCTSPNILIFDTNVRHIENRNCGNKQAAAFVRPGFEKEDQAIREPFRLTSHRLEVLLRKQEYERLTAVPRIQELPADQRDAKTKLVDLEHARLLDMMEPDDLQTILQPTPRGLRSEKRRLNAAGVWQYPHAMLTGVLPQQQPFRDDSTPEVELVFLPDKDEENLILHRVEKTLQRGAPEIYTPIQHLLTQINLNKELGARINPWGKETLYELLEQQLLGQGLSLAECARKFAVASVFDSTNGWSYHPSLGFSKLH